MAPSWINAWSGWTGLGAKQVDAVAQTGALGELTGATVKPVCSDDGYVRPQSNRGESAHAAVLATTLVSDREQTLEVRVGTSGRLTLQIGDAALVFEPAHNLGERALPDERFATITLPKGVTPIVATLKPDNAGFFLRLRTPEGLPAPGLAAFEPFPQAACKTGPLLSFSPRMSLSPKGPRFEATPRFLGLVPVINPNSALSVRVGDDSPWTGKSLPAQDLVSSSFAVSEQLTFASKQGAYLSVDFEDRKVLNARFPQLQGVLIRVLALRTVLDKVLAQTNVASGSRASFERVVTELEQALLRNEADHAWVDGLLTQAEQLAEAFSAGQDPYATKRGVVARGLYSKIDGKLQPYVAFIPPSLDKLAAAGKKLPLVLVAHGRDRLPEHALRTLVGEAADEKVTLSYAAHHLPAFPDQGAVLAAPWGFGNGGTHAVSEQDLLQVIEELQASYPIDPRRISLTGYSLGGTVSFALPLHFPGRFSAAAPLCGYPNLLDYNSVAKVPHLPWEETLLQKEYLVRYAENGLHVPLNIVHGGKDAPGRSKVVADRYKQLGYKYTFDIQEDLEHNVWDYAYEDGKMVNWLKRQSVPEQPAKVRLTTGKLRYDRAHWLKLLAMLDSSSSEPAELTASVDAETHTVEVTASNVFAFEIDLPSIAPLLGAQATVVVGSQRFERETSASVALIRDESGEFTVKGQAAQPLRKRHRQSGPMDDAFHEPLLFVVGTLDPAHTESHRLAAAHLAKLGGAADVDYPVIDDVNVSMGTLANSSVVLLGGPQQNAVTKRIAEFLPAKFEPDAIVFRGVRYSQPHTGLSFIYPAPKHFDEVSIVPRGFRETGYIIVHAGLSSHATLNARFLPRLLPDFVIYDDAVAQRRGDLLLAERKVMDAGFFKENWE
jgi:poly(3-hydroxybutyrate) depolymerase